MNATQIPEKVRDLATRPRLSPSVRPERLTGPQLKALRGMLSGEVTARFTPNLINVMDILIHADDTPETVELIGSVIEDEWRSGAERAFAATVLRRSSDPAAPQMLANRLHVADPTVLIQVIRSLAAVGTPGELEPLERIETVPGSPVDKQLVFAREVIAHRAGLDIDFAPSRRGVKRTPGQPEQMIDLALRPLTKKRLASERARLDGTSYQMPIGDRGFKLTAGHAAWTVLTNAELSDAGGYGSMFDRPWLTAVLARHEARTKRSHVQYVVLSHPAGRTTRINVFRTDGELMYTGTMKRARELFEFSMRDVSRKATAPTNVSGRITRKGPVFDMTIPFGSRSKTREGNEGTPVV